MWDRIFRGFLWALSALIILLTAGMIYSLVYGSLGAFEEFGLWGFITSREWNPTEGREAYGALPFIVGTLLTSLLALLLCIPLALPVALFTGYYRKNTRTSRVLTTIIDLLAGVPSIVYGLWGFYTVRPLVAQMGINSQGLGIVTASLVLAIMIVPYASSLCREFLLMVPNELVEASSSLGATNLGTVRYVTLPTARKGIIAGFVLALGRALGETMAVTMLIGNTNTVPTSLRDTGNTMASIIANQFGEAHGLKLHSLVAIGLILFLLTLVINMLAKVITREEGFRIAAAMGKKKKK